MARPRCDAALIHGQAASRDPLRLRTGERAWPRSRWRPGRDARVPVARRPFPRESGCGFVQQEHPWIQQQRADQGETLPLSGGKAQDRPVSRGRRQSQLFDKRRRARPVGKMRPTVSGTSRNSSGDITDQTPSTYGAGISARPAIQRHGDRWDRGPRSHRSNKLLPEPDGLSNSDTFPIGEIVTPSCRPGRRRSRRKASQARGTNEMRLVKRRRSAGSFEKPPMSESLEFVI